MKSYCIPSGLLYVQLTLQMQSVHSSRIDVPWLTVAKFGYTLFLNRHPFVPMSNNFLKPENIKKKCQMRDIN